MLDMECITQIRQVEHAQHLCLFQLNQSAVAEHCYETGP
jgi:hypothetical protein